ERRDAVRRRTAVSHLHVRVVGREHRAVQAQGVAAEVELETDLERVRRLGLELLERRLLCGLEHPVEVTVPAAALEALRVAHVAHPLRRPTVRERRGY